METPTSPSAAGDGNSAPASSRMTIEDILRGDESYYKMLGYPDAASYFEAKEQNLLLQYSRKVFPLLWPILQKDSLTRFYRLCHGWSRLMGLRGFIYPEILSSMVANNAVRCARAVLQGRAPLRGRRADPNGRHPYGYTALHLAAETFSVEMVKLLLRHGASANHCTEGYHVIEGLLPLHIAVENASMHKYLEDHWVDGHSPNNLISLLCLPEMKMYLDTTRLIAQHTHNIVDELWDYIDKKKVVQLAILLLASQKQLRGPINRSCGKAYLNGFESIRHRTYEAISGLHLQMIAMVNEGKNGSALKKLKDKKEALLTADALVGILDKAGQALEDYIQTNSEVHHKEILEHVSSILNSKGIVPSGKGIATANLKCYRYPGQTTSIKKSCSRVDTRGTNEADKSYTLNAEGCKRIPAKRPPKGLAVKAARDKFFPFWKSVLSARLPVKIVPPCEPSSKDIQRTEPSKDIQSTEASRKDLQPPNKSIANLVSTSRPPLASNYECRRQLCALASMSLKVLRRT